MLVWIKFQFTLSKKVKFPTLEVVVVALAAVLAEATVKVKALVEALVAVLVQMELIQLSQLNWIFHDIMEKRIQRVGFVRQNNFFNFMGLC